MLWHFVTSFQIHYHSIFTEIYSKHSKIKHSQAYSTFPPKSNLPETTINLALLLFFNKLLSNLYFVLQVFLLLRCLDCIFNWTWMSSFQYNNEVLKCVLRRVVGFLVPVSCFRCFMPSHFAHPLFYMLWSQLIVLGLCWSFPVILRYISCL